MFRVSCLSCLPLALASTGVAAHQSESAQAPSPPAVTTPGPVRRLDGEFDDWSQLDPVATRRDDASDVALGAPDLVTVSLASDPSSFWIALHFANEVTIQGLDRPLRLYIDTDHPSVGAVGGPLPGADLVVIFSPTPFDRGDAKAEAGNTKPGQGIGVVVRRLTERGELGEVVPAESIGLGMAPTHASRTFEVRLDRNDQQFAELTTAVRAVSMIPDDLGRMQLAEEVEPTRTLLVPRRKSPSPKASASALARTPGTDLRVVSWNAERGALFKDAESFAAILTALRPDVILWQELGATKPDELVAWMNTHAGAELNSEAGERWHVVLSGGDLRTAVVARRPMQVAPFLDGVKRSAGEGKAGAMRDVRVAGALLDPDGDGPIGSLLFASLHLKCCGRVGSDEDIVRLAEAKAIREAIASARTKLADAGTPLAGIVVGGDFNLVGTRSVLDEVGAGLDSDGSALDPVAAYRLDGLTNATWRTAGDQFLPGRLDWILLSSGSLRTMGSFVFDGVDLSADAARSLALPPKALAEPSDHLPIVVDLALPSPPSPSR
jgi:endonuclease/exonuclease/phosphatase family metal-dependent hydrolase